VRRPRAIKRKPGSRGFVYSRSDAVGGTVRERLYDVVERIRGGRLPKRSLVSVVEDDQFSRESMRRFIRSMGYGSSLNGLWKQLVARVTNEFRSRLCPSDVERDQIETRQACLSKIDQTLC
jgi:hypothetical protein